MALGDNGFRDAGIANGVLVFFRVEMGREVAVLFDIAKCRLEEWEVDGVGAIPVLELSRAVFG